MKTVNELLYEYVVQRNTKQEVIEYDEKLKQGIQKYIEDGHIEAGLQNDMPLDQRVINMHFKNLDQLSYHELLFYFYNYSQIKSMWTYESTIQFYIKNQIILDQGNAIEMYLRLMTCIYTMVCLEYVDKPMNYFLDEIEESINIATQKEIF